MSKSMKGGKRKASLTQPTVEERRQQPNGQVVIAPKEDSSSFKSKKWPSSLIIVAIIAISLSLITLFTYQGFVLFKPAEQFNESIDETFTSPQEYEWAPQHEGKLNSLWITGSYLPGEEESYARVVVTSLGINYTLFDSRATDEFSPTVITGFAIDEVNSTSGATNETSSNEPPQAAPPVESIASENISLTNNTPAGQDESVEQNTSVEESDMLESNVTALPPAENLTEPLLINLVLEYQSETAFDEDNDGIATVKDAIDFTIAPTAFSAEPNFSKLCTIWTVENTQSSTKRCHGSTDCCAFANLASSSDNWDEAYYAAYNKDGAALENTIFVEVISYDVDMASSKVDIASSGKKSLPARFTAGEIAIEKSCKDACILPGWNLSSYTLHIELSQGAILSLDSIGYLMEERMSTGPILLRDIPNMTLVKGEERSINLSQYFADEDGDALQYSFYTMDNISIAVYGDTASFIPSLDFIGTQFTYLSATDGATTVTSNVFRVDVLESEPSEERIVVGKPVVWINEILIEDISNDTLTFDIPETALNVSVGLITGAHEDQILPTQISIKDNNEEVSAGEFQDGQKIEQVAREISIIEEGQKRGSGLIILEGQNLTDDDFAKAIPKLKKEKKDREEGPESSLPKVPKGKSQQDQIIPSITEDNDTIATVVVENLTSIQPLVDTILVEYTTEAPIMVQTKTSQSTQEVNIYSNTHYENVSVGADIDDTPKESITLYWIQNGTRSEFTDVAYLDSNLNGQIDRLEWVVPHLSNQTFEISITVLNVQSYPIVGGNWEVRFVTTGTANLTISGFNETTYTEMEIDNASTFDDLLPKSLTCSNSTLYDFDSRYMNDTVWLVTGDNQTVKFGDVSSLTVPITSLFVQSYSCDNATASWVSQVKTPGKHHQRFAFGGQEAEAHNFAISSCTNFTQGDAQYDLDSPILIDFTSPCFRLNYSNLILDGHLFNISTSVIATTVVNILANSTTVLNLNISDGYGGNTIVGGTSVDHIYNSMIVNNKLNIQSSSPRGISYSSTNYNTTIINNSITSPYSSGSAILIYFSGSTTKAFIDHNNLSASVGGGGNTATCIYFNSAAHANNTISYNRCNSAGTNDRIYGISMVTSGQGNLFDHNIINLSTGGTYPTVDYNNMALSGINGGDYISNITISNNQLYDNGGGNHRSNLRFTYISGSNAGVNIFSNIVSASGSGYTSLAALSATEVRNMRFWNNTWHTKNIGIYLNGTGSTAAVSIDTNITFINDTIAACTDNPSCGNNNITSILLTENVTNVYMQDVRFNKTQIRVVSREPGDQSAEKNNITVQWTFDMNVTRASNGQAIQTAFVQINNSKGQTLYNGTVNSLGAINSTLITEFTQNGTVVPFYQSCTEQTDETGDATANFSCHMPLKISVTDFGNAEVGFLFYLNQTNKTTVQMEVASVVSVGGCVNFTQGNTQYDLYAPIFQDFSSTCFKLNYTNITLDGHNFNITSSVAGAVVVNVTSNFSTVRGMNLTGSNSVSSSNKIHAQGVISNLTISNNFIYSQGSSSENIEIEGTNYNVTIMGNKLVMPSSTYTSAIMLNGLTTNALITQNSINASSGSGTTQGVCIDFFGVTTAHSNNIISYNNCTIPVASGGGMRLTGTGNGNIIDHNIINYSDTLISAINRQIVSLGTGSGSTPTRNMTVSNNIIWSQTSGGQLVSLYIYVLDGRAEKAISVYNNIIAMSGKSPAALLATSIKNIRFWNNTFYGRTNGIVLNGTGTTSAANIDTNITFINDTISACPDNAACSNTNLTPILLTENVTNVYMQDVRFNKTLIKIVTRESNGAETNNLTVQWTLDLNVTNLSDGNVIPAAIVQINNSKGQMLYNGMVNSLGAINSTLITEFTQNGTVVPFYQSCTEQTDETGDATANFSCFMPLNISITAVGYIPVGFSFYLNQTNKTTVQIAIIDVTPPIVNTSFNISTFIKGNVLNYTANITDEYILSNATWSHNVSGFYVFVNYTLSGKTAQVSNFTTLPAGLFNFTITARDTFGNEKSNSTIIQVSTAHISNCTVLNETGVSYYLQNNISTPVPANGVCFNITASSVTLDCQGRFVNGSDDGYGLWAEKVEGITIKNCSFWNWGSGDPEAGIYFTQVGNSTIRNINSSLNARFGVYLDTPSMRNNITDIVVFSNTVGMGIYGNSNRISNIRAHSSINNEGVIIQSSFNTVSNITTYSNPTGLYVYGDYNNISFVNASFNTAYSGIQFYSSDFNRLINVTASSNVGGGLDFLYSGQSGENFIANSTFQDNTARDVDLNDNNGGYCMNKFENITLSGSYPFGFYNYSVQLSNMVLSELILCNADGSNLTNITVAGSQTINNNGVFLYAVSRAKLSNINSSGNYAGILTYLSSSNTFSNITANNNTYGIFSEANSYDNFSNIYSFGSTMGIYMVSNPSNNVFFNALIADTPTGIRLDGSQNTFEFITINKTTTDAIAFADATVNATFKNSILAGCAGEGIDTSAAPTQLYFDYLANYSCKLGNVPKIYYNYSLPIYPFDKRATNGNFYLNQSTLAVDGGYINATMAISPDGSITLSSYYTAAYSEFGLVDLGYHYSMPAVIDTLNISLVTFDSSPNDNEGINWSIFGTAYAGSTSNFYGNLTLDPQNTPITTGNCSIKFNDTEVVASFNSATNLYEVNRSFYEEGIYDWNLTCILSGEDKAINNTNITVYIPTNITYETSQFIGVGVGYANITANYWRYDRNLPISGEINITMNGITKSCNATNCSKGFTVPTELPPVPAVYLVNISIGNYSPYYTSASILFNFSLDVIVPTSLTNETTITYTGVNDAENTHFNITSFFNRTDANLPIIGVLNITFGNSTVNISKVCYGQTNCSKGFRIGPTGDFRFAQNYTVHLSATNDTAFYQQQNKTYTIFLEEPVAQGDLASLDKSITDFQVGVDYILEHTVTLQNHLESTMYDVNIINTSLGGSPEVIGIINVSTTCQTVLPGASCTAVFNITIDGNVAGSGSQFNGPFFFANWTNNNGSVSSRLNNSWVIEVNPNPAFTLSQGIINFTRNIGASNYTVITIANTGSETLGASGQGANSVFITHASGGTIPTNWVSFERAPSSNSQWETDSCGTDCFSFINVANTRNFIVNITPTYFYPGTYVGTINITAIKSGNVQIYHEINISITIAPQITLSADSINLTDNIGQNLLPNITINNTGNAPLTRVNVTFLPIALPASWVRFDSTTSSFNTALDVFSRISENGSAILTLNITALDFSEGVYTGIVNITTNESISAAFNLTINVSPQLNVSPSALLFNTNLSNSPTHFLNLSSLGNAPLTNISINWDTNNLTSSWVSLNSTASSWNLTSSSFSRISEHTHSMLNITMRLENFTRGWYTGVINITTRENKNASINLTLDINPQLTIHNSSVSSHHGRTINITLQVNSTGNVKLINVTAKFLNSSLSSEWTSLVFESSSGQTVALGNISEGTFKFFNVTIALPQFQDPGDYSGLVNITADNEFYQTSNITVTVLANSTWNIVEPINETKVFNLNEGGQIGNLTINNTGNIPLNFTVSYDTTFIMPGATQSCDSYKCIGISPISEGNLPFVHVPKNSTATIIVYHKSGGSSIARLNIGVNVTLFNASGSPTTGRELFIFNVTDYPPIMVNLSTAPIGEAGTLKNYTELNHSITLSAVISDDEVNTTTRGMNFTSFYFNVTRPDGTRFFLNYSAMSIASDNQNDEIPPELERRHFNVTFTNTSIQGVYNLSAYIRDKNNNVMASSVFQFEVIGATTLTSVGNQTNATSISQARNNTVTALINITNTGRATAYAISVNVTSAQAGWVSSLASVGNLSESALVQAELNITVPPATTPGSYSVTPVAFWTEPNGSQSSSSGTAFTIIVAANPEVNLTSVSLSSNLTIYAQHGHSYQFNITVNGTGNDDYRSAILYFVNRTFSVGTVSLSSGSSSLHQISLGTIQVNELQNQTVYVSVTSGTAPGSYYGEFVVNSSFYGPPRERRINFTTIVAIDGNYTTTLTPIQSDFPLNEPGIIANLTIANWGNTEFSFVINYTNFSQTSFNNFVGLFNISQNTSDVLVNRNLSTLSPATSTTFSIYQNGWYASLQNIGILIALHNDSASPSTTTLNLSFNITEMPPQADLLFPNGNTTEINNSMYIKVVGLDDAALNTSLSELNITYPDGTVVTINASNSSEFMVSNSNYIAMNFSTIFNATTQQGIYNITATIRDLAGYANSTQRAQFEVLGVTTLALASSNISINITSINFTRGASLILDINISNAGLTRAYALNLSGNLSPATINWAVNYTAAVNLSSGTLLPAQLLLTIPNATPPGTYPFMPYLIWRQPNGSMANISMPALNITIASNKRTTFFNLTRNLSIHHGINHTYSVDIGSIGNDNASAINLSVQNIPATFRVSFNESVIPQINPGTNRSVQLSVSPALGTPNGTYSFDVLLSNNNLLWDNYTVNVGVPVNQSYNISRSSLTISALQNQNDQNEEIVIRSLANVPLAFTLDLSGEIVDLDYANLLNTSITLSSLDTFGVPINYTGTSAGSYSGSLDVIFGSTTTIPITFNVYLGNLTIVNVTPQTNLLVGQNINLTSILLFSGSAITADTVFGVEINGSSCPIPTNVSQGNYMVITCTAPPAADGRYHNVRLNANYSIGGTVARLTTFNTSLVYYMDVTPPSAVLFPLANTLLGQNISIAANATDNIAIDRVIAQITSPNGTIANFTLGNHSTIYNISLNTSLYLSELGTYQLQLFANDTSGNLNNSAVGSFSVYQAIVHEGAILDLSSRPYSVNFTFSNPSTPTAFYSNGSGNYSAVIYSGNYDITMSYGIFTFRASNVSFSNQQTDFIDMDNLSSSDVENQLSGALGGIAFNTSMPNQGSVALDYSSYGITDESKIRMYHCSNYGYGSKTCLGQWSLLNPYTLNTVSNTLNATVSLFANTTSAFVLRETSGNTSVMELPNTAITFTINHSETASQEFEIRSIGGADLTDVGIVCISGTACDNLGFTPEFIPSIASSQTDHADINITVPQHFAPGTYLGIMSVISNQVAETATLRVIVPTMNTFNTTLDTGGLAVGSKATGTYGTLTILNTGNVPLAVGINSSSNLTPSKSSSYIAIGASDTVAIRYTAPKDLGNYTLNVSVNGTMVNVSLNVTLQATIETFSPSANVNSSGILEIHANITAHGTAINESVTWEAAIDGYSCDNLTSNIAIFWNISCVLPSMTDNMTHTLRIAGTSNSMTAYDDTTILYRDIFGPSIILFTGSANYSQDVPTQINATARDDNNLSNASVVMLSPTGASIATNVSITNFTVTISANISEIGDYNITYTLYDNLSNSRSINRTFELIMPYNFSGNILRGNGSSVQNITFRLYRSDGTSIAIATNSSGGYSGLISQRVYNSMEINTSFNTLITLNQVNLSGVSDPFDIDELETSTLVIPGSDDELVAFAVNTSLNNSGNLRFYYNGLGVNDPNDLAVFKCSNFSYSGRNCNTLNWEEQSGTLGFGYYDVSITGFSGYVLSETPEPTNSTTTSSTTTTSSSSGGGGGGGGGAILTTIKDLLEKLLEDRVGKIDGLVLSRAKIDLELFQGEQTQTILSMTNENKETLNLEFEISDSLGEYISLGAASLSLKEGQPGALPLIVEIPEYSAPKVYFGSLYIISSGVRQEVPIEVRVLERTEMQPQIKIKPIYTAILAGQPFRVQTEITNPQKILRRFNLSMELIRTETNNALIEDHRSYMLDSDYVEIIDLNTTENFLLGDYYIKATLSWKEPDGRLKERTTSEPVQVSKKPLLEQLSTFMRQRYFFFEPWQVVMLLLLLTAGMLEYRHHLAIKEKKKKYHVQVDLNTLPYPTEHAGYIGYVAETNVRTFIDMDKLTTHAIIAGSTGGGKTVSTQVIVEEALKKGIAVVVFDPTAQWSGFLRKCDDKDMLRNYDKFGMKKKEAQSFNGNIHLITNPRELISLKDVAKPGEVHIFALNRIDLREIDIFVANTVHQVFRSSFEESPELKILLIYDEVHRLLPKYGGTGAGLLQIERACREFRKWGIGLMLISQVLSDFKGQIKANINTELQMRTRDESDLDRMKTKYGEEMLQALMKANIGVGMVQNSEYNKGRPYLVEFRPLLHSPRRLSDSELNQYDKHNALIADIANELQQLESLGADVFDLNLELKLATDKLKKGEFTVLNIYLEGLKPRISDMWKKIGKSPKKREIALVSESDIKREIELAALEHEKALKAFAKGQQTEIPVSAQGDQELPSPKEAGGQEQPVAKESPDEPIAEKISNAAPKKSAQTASTTGRKKEISGREPIASSKMPKRVPQKPVKFPKGQETPIENEPKLPKKVQIAKANSSSKGQSYTVTTSKIEQKYKTIKKLIEDAKAQGKPVMSLKLRLISLEGDIDIAKMRKDESKWGVIDSALEDIRQKVPK